MFVQTWADVVAGSLQGVWIEVMRFLPGFLGALVVFVLGLIVATGLGTLVQKVLESLKLDSAVSKLGIQPFFDRAGLRLRTSWFFGQLVYWFFVVVFLLAAADILKLTALSEFLRQVALFIPNIVIAVLIMLAAVVVGNFLRKIITASVMGAELHAAHFLGTLAWWSVVVFGLFAAMFQLGIATPLLNTLITGLVAMLAIAGGIAFGLGGKGYAEHLLNKLREQTEKR